VRVKGKLEALSCYELFNFSGQASANERELIENFEAAFLAYTEGRFEKAIKLFRECDELEAIQQEGANNPSRLYIRRCHKLTLEPPKNWDGIWHLTDK
jgi:hypothetical protein